MSSAARQALERLTMEGRPGYERLWEKAQGNLSLAAYELAKLRVQCAAIRYPAVPSALELASAAREICDRLGGLDPDRKAFRLRRDCEHMGLKVLP